VELEEVWMRKSIIVKVSPRLSPNYHTLGSIDLQNHRVPAYLAGVKAGCVHLCRSTGNTVSSHMASDTPQL